MGKDVKLGVKGQEGLLLGRKKSGARLAHPSFPRGEDKTQATHKGQGGD